MTMTVEERAWKAQFLEQQERQTAALENVAIGLGQIAELLAVLVRQQEILLMQRSTRVRWAEPPEE